MSNGMSGASDDLRFLAVSHGDPRLFALRTFEQ